jgi:hypothetical protein
MIYGGHRTLNPHPRPSLRKTSALDRYYKNGIPDSEGLGSLRFSQTIRYALVQSTTGLVDTGACYTGCSASNVNACRPIEFANLSDAQYYAQQHNEKLVVLGTAVPDSPTWNALRNLAFEDCGVQLSQTTTPGTPGSISTTVTTTTTPTSVTGGGGPTGGGDGSTAVWTSHDPGVPTGPPDNTLLYLGLAALAFVMLSK